MRQPFPGPGLAIRVIGEATKERLDILRDAQAVKQEIGAYIAEQLKLELSDEKTLVTKAATIGS